MLTCENCRIDRINMSDPGESRVKVAISAMTMADYDSVCPLLASIPGLTMRSADSFEATQRYLLRNPGLSLVARSGDRVVGCVMCGHDGRRGYLQHLAVEPNMRHLGIGTALVTRCLDALRHLEIEKIHIDVLADNAVAHEYWTNSGWKRRTDIVRYSFTNSTDLNV
jgi:ribosomal protein S18 acetylase RimI-like enzyme